MPKETRRRSGEHLSSAKLSKRSFAVRQNAVEHLEAGALAEASGADILKAMAEENPEAPRPAMKKKEKQALKHELFLQRLESSRSPYSKSHERRMKRKARDQVAGGLSDLRVAISAVDDIPQAVVESSKGNDSDMRVDTAAKPRPKAGQIGEGKKAPLSKSQRKRALQLERFRIPKILSTPEFASNPFATIRTHAQNTLVKHEPPQ